MAFIAPSVAFATPGAPAPHPRSLASVQRELQRLSVQNSQLVEQYDQAQVSVGKAHAQSLRALHTAAAAESTFQHARDFLAAAVTAQYEGGGFALTGALLSSGSGESYLDRLNTMSAVSTHTAQVVAGASAAEHAATAQQGRAKALLAVTTAKRNELASRQAAVQLQLAKYKALLATLDSAQRLSFLNSTNPSLPLSAIQGLTFPQASKAAQKAVKFALAQVGKPYVYGSAGPDSFDCSGLTMAAWASAGVALPHSAADQYNYGHHVSVDALRPGDLVFLYQPIGHVTIYIGDGLMVSAPQEGENVSVVQVSRFAGSIVGATHLG